MGHVCNKHNCTNTFEMHGRQVQCNYQLWGMENSDATTALTKHCTEFLKQGSKKRGLDVYNSLHCPATAELFNDRPR
eukprot:4360164-Pleurochrysis_carterae.AAC.1